ISAGYRVIEAIGASGQAGERVAAVGSGRGCVRAGAGAADGYAGDSGIDAGVKGAVAVDVVIDGAQDRRGPRNRDGRGCRPVIVAEVCVVLGEVDLCLVSIHGAARGQWGDGGLEAHATACANSKRAEVPRDLLAGNEACTAA